MGLTSHITTSQLYFVQKKALEKFLKGKWPPILCAMRGYGVRAVNVKNSCARLPSNSDRSLVFCSYPGLVEFRFAEMFTARTLLVRAALLALVGNPGDQGQGEEVKMHRFRL